MSEQTTSEATQVKPEPKPYHIEKSTVEEKVINPMRPDFNASAQSSYLAENEKLNHQGDEQGDEDQNDTDEVEIEDQKTEDSEEENKDSEVSQVTSQPSRQEKINKYLAEMAKKQAELRRKEKELEEKYNSKSNFSIDELKNKAKEDPLSVLKELGLSYNDLTKRIISGKDSDEKQVLNKALSRLEELENQIKKDKELSEQREIEQKVQNYKSQLRDHISKKENEYELINATQSYEAVYDTIAQYYDQTKRMLTFDEAANVVETELEKQELSRLESILKTNKARKWGLKRQEGETTQDLTNDSPKAPNANSEAIVKSPNQSGAQKTITGDMVATTPMQRKRRMSRDESIAEAAKMLRFHQ